MTPSLVLVGNLLVDDIVFADGSTRMGQAGGAILYAALGAALWNAQPGIVSLAGDDYPADVLNALRQRGVDLGGLHRLGPRGGRTWLLYEGDVRRLVHWLGCPSHDEASPRPHHFPVSWHSAAAFHVAPMPFAVQRLALAVARARDRRFISIDPHMTITKETLPEWRAALTDADMFLPGEDELLLDGAREHPEDELPRLVSGRLRFVAFKRGAHGGILYDAHDKRFYPWTARVDRVVDQTGAGDAFAMGFVTAHLEGQPVEGCLQRAVVTASFALEGWGSESLIAATRADAEARLRRWYPTRVET